MADKLTEQLQNILEKYSDYLGWDEETYTSIYGIDQARIPAVASELANTLREDKQIADNMRDYWISLADGAH